MHWEDFLAIDYLAILRAQGIQIKCNVLFSKGGYEILVELVLL